MGEHAHETMRQEIQDRHGYDIGEYDDEPPKRFVKPTYKRVQCPHCNKRPKERGLLDHIRDAHGIGQEVVKP
jgi:hypothetical protein